MARKVFFSFHYARDLWRVNVVRNSGMIEGVAAAGFHDASLWEETKKRGDEAVKRLIDDSLRDTTVTVVLIGAESTGKTSLCERLAARFHTVWVPEFGREHWERKIAGQTIANIYDYTYALELLKIGQPVKIIYMRGAERRETMMTPSARK